MKTIKTGYEPLLHPTTPQEGKRAPSKKMNIDEAFGVVCKYLDDYENFLMMVKMMREAQKEFEDCPMENEADIQRLGKKAEVIEQAVDNWLEKNM